MKIATVNSDCGPRNSHHDHDVPRVMKVRSGVWRLSGLMHIVRMSSRQKSSSTGAKSTSRPSMQRCAVRITYSPNRTRGQWAAHGRYLARESAMHSDTGNIRAFGPSGSVSDIHATLGSWQKAGDPRLFKLIISPEFGERCGSGTTDAKTHRHHGTGPRYSFRKGCDRSLQSRVIVGRSFPIKARQEPHHFDPAPVQPPAPR